MKRQNVKTVSALRLLIVALFAAAALLAVLPFGAMHRADASDTEEVAAPPKTVSATESAADDPVDDFTLVLYYFRPAGDYTDWNVWLWQMGKEGTGVYFNASAPINGKDCMWLERHITNAKEDADGNVLGFIMRKGNWDDRDMGSNRYITADMIEQHKNGNELEIYLVQGVSEIYFDPSEALVDRITNAEFNSTATKVTFGVNTPLTASNKFALNDGTSDIATLDCSATTKFNGQIKAEFTLPNNFTLDYGKAYKVVDARSTPRMADGYVSIRKLYDTQGFNTACKYEGELGVNYTATKSTFTVWSPGAADMKLNIYADSTTNVKQIYDMTRGSKGEWTAEVNGDLNGSYYTYTANVDGKVKEVVDPYARSGGANGTRGMILDLDSTDPDGWATQSEPTLGSYGEAVIYEAHLRDLTIHLSSNVTAAKRGKFLGLTELGTESAPTPLRYLKELGVTAVHFQPLFDFATVNETFTEATYNADGQNNWGYDPLNYNMPEGSYSSNPADGRTRVNEMKQMVMALHNAGIQVVMDVVYNHVSNAADSNFEALVPGYYFRYNEDGGYESGSGCGNDTASERPMFGRFMRDSVKYWMTEYKIDGFRFDLMALHDIDTMNAIYDDLAALNPDVMVYGEGWMSGTSGLAGEKQAKLANASQMPHIAFFNDIIRDGLKGSVFSITDNGFVSGKDVDAAVYVGAAGGTSALSASVYGSMGKSPFAGNPLQSVNYASAHDNSALWDKLNASTTESRDAIKAMNRLSATSVLTSQGVSFFLAGEELLRSKPTTKDNSYENRPEHWLTDESYYFSDNSYKSPDSVNAINWELATTNADMVEYYKGLIAIKRNFPQFHISTTEQLAQCLTVNDADLRDGVAAYAVKDPASNEYAVVILNNKPYKMSVSVPNGEYKVYVNGDKATGDKENPLSTLNGSSVTVGARSAVVMTATLEAQDVSAWSVTAQQIKDKNNLGLALGLGIGIPAGLLVAGGVVFGVMYGKKKKGGNGKSESADGANGEQEEKPSQDDSRSEPEAEKEQTADQTGEDNPAE